MTTHTDRIMQMAQEAGLLPCHEVYVEDLTPQATPPHPALPPAHPCA